MIANTAALFETYSRRADFRTSAGNWFISGKWRTASRVAALVICA